MSLQENNVKLPLLSFSAYEIRANAANQFLHPSDVLNLRYGFFGEVGGLLAAVKKSRRELGATEQDTVLEELGDALWYFTTIVRQYHLQLESVGEAALVDMQHRLNVSDRQRARTPLTFHEFDGLIAFCHGELPESSKERLLCDLAARTGELVSRDPSQEHDLGAHPPDQLLSKVLADMVMVAAIFNLGIAEIAESNLNKIESRWPPADAKHIDLFDLNMPDHEQLPRQFAVQFIEREVNGKKFVFQRLNGVNIGDRLTDNRVEPDGYRFHDVFHLAYAAHLGWSPVIRGLLKYKRKSDPSKDENEDGARAMIIEEGIATWIFNHAFYRQYYVKVTKGKLEYGLLKQVQDMVKGYEVHKCPLWQWELAILDGFSVFRQLLHAGGGYVHVDIDQHTIRFQAITPALAGSPEINDTVIAPSIQEVGP